MRCGRCDRRAEYLSWRIPDRGRHPHGRHSGRLPGDTDPETPAAFYAAVIQGMNQQACDGASRQVLEAVAESSMRAWPDTKA